MGGVGKMNRVQSIWRTVKFIVLTLACWAAVHGTALAKAAEEEKGPKGGPTSWIVPYALVLLGITFGLLFVLKSAGRREREKPETYEESKKLPGD